MLGVELALNLNFFNNTNRLVQRRSEMLGYTDTVVKTQDMSLVIQSETVEQHVEGPASPISGPP